MDVITSIPNCNSNGMGFTKETLKNSYQSMNLSPLDYEHEQHVILGSVVDSEIVEKNDLATMRTAAVTWKHRLRDCDIEDLSTLKYSMECFYDNYDFYTKSKGIVKKNNAPKEWLAEATENKWLEPVYDDNGDRVIMLLGGSDGFVEFSGIGITKNPADKTTLTLFQAAKEETKGGKDIMFTQEQVDKMVSEALESFKNGEMKSIIESAKASVVSEKETEFNKVKGDLETALASEKERADKAEATINETVKEATFKNRMEAIASKNLKVRDERHEFVKNATDDEFDTFVADLEELASSFVVNTATASVNSSVSVVPNLTIKNSNKTEDRNPFL